ncbi:MAG: UPF0755 protein [Pseudohongiellaceae bacterium]|jgi:UPF0755 protein
MNYSALTSSNTVRGSLAVLGLTFVLFLALGWFALNYLRAPLPVAVAGVVFEVTPGSSLTSVSRQLDELGVVQYPQILRLWARYQGVANAIKAGEYAVADAQTPAQLLANLVAGKAIQYRLTLVEGWTFAEALAQIHRNPKIAHTLVGKPIEQVSAEMGLSASNPEGLLYPDTYFFTANTRDLELLNRAHRRLNTVLSAAWEQRLGALPYASAYEALVMASIIEKESGASSEREQIAGVFVRRLELNMRLQSDPTVIYGMAENYDGDIRRADLRQVTPYNTYRINGLPPTPIALAGLESITAALNPLSGNSLYFVARGDGTHYFSSSLEEHNSAVARFQLTGQSRSQ